MAVCMPAALERAYKEQFEAVARRTTNVESWFDIISDVHLAENGEAWTLTLMPSPRGSIHIEHFSAEGSRVGSRELLLETGDV